MRDMLPRKPTTTLADIKKGLKDSLYGNGMSSASPGHISPVPSGESSSPAQDINEATSNYIPSMPKPLTPSISAGAIASPLSSPGIRAKTSPKHKLRRNQSMDSKQKNQLFDFDGNSTENNYCANNNNSSKLTRRHSMKPDDNASRTPSRNSVSDELSSSSLTPTTDEQINSAGAQNLELNSIFDNVDDEMFYKVLKNIEKAPDDSLGLPDDLPEFDAVVSSFQNSSDGLLFESNPLRTSQTGDLLEGLSNSTSSPRRQQYSSTVTSATNSTSAQRIPQISMESSTSSPASSTKFSHSSDSTQTMGKSHLLDILGVTDTIRLKTMSRAIDTVPYKSPMTTTSYSTTGMKLTPAVSCTMASRSRLPSNMSFSNKPLRPQYMFNHENPMFRPNSQGFMDNGANGPWGRGSPRHVHPNLLKSPPFSGSYVETSMNPSLVNPMSGLQNTVDSIPAAPVGTSNPGTPVMGPPLLRSPHGFEAATPSPGGGRMRPPPSPSVMIDKRCPSADSVSSSNIGKKAGNKRERTRSADSKEDEKKETSAPKNKRRKSRSKDENLAGKKESKTPGRSTKDEKSQRHDSALSGLLDVQKSDPYMFVFNTDIANRAAAAVNNADVPHIILFHQSFLGNCQLQPSGHFKPKMTNPEQIPMSDTPSMSMPTTCRSPTEMPVEKYEPIRHQSPRISPPRSNLENVQAINLQDTKLLLLPSADHMNNIEKHSVNEPITSQSIMMMSRNGSQEELSAEKRRHREDKLDKIRKIQERLFQQEDSITGNVMPRGPGWHGPHPHHPGQVHYGPMPGMPIDNRPPGRTDLPIPADAMMPPGGQPMTQENVEWHQLIQEHNAEKRRQHGAGMRGELPSRPPPPYGMNGPQHRWMGPDEYQVEARMPMDPMNHPRLQRVGSGHRQLVRMPQDPRIPVGYLPPRMVISRVPYPPNQQQRMPMYEPYMGPTGMRAPSRLPHPSHPNYPFSEKLMKQASYYNTNMPPTMSQCDPELQMAGEWVGGEGPQRIPHIPGSTSPAMGPQGMINSVEMNPRMTPGIPNRGYEQHMGSYNPEMEQRFDVLPMGSPPGSMESRMQGPSGALMMDAIARRGVQRPPDLNLSNQILPRSPMNYHGHGPLPSPSVNIINQSVGPRYSNPGEMGHLPQPLPMHTRSPQMVMGQPHLPMGPASAGIEPPQQMMLGPGPQMGGPPHSAGPLTNPPHNEWSGHIHNIPRGTPTPNSGMMHPGNMVQVQPGSMSSQSAMMSSQPGMMSSQPVMMMSSGMQQLQPGRMMTSPGMMSQPVMMTSQSQGLPRMQNVHSVKHGTNMLSIMRERMSMYKMPEKTPLYQDAVKDTSPPTLNHPNDVQRMPHNPMSVAMRMPAPNHPQSVAYDTRMGPPRMSIPHHHINENFQPRFPGDGHPSPMSGHPMLGQGCNGMMMNMGLHEPMGPLPGDYQQPIRNFPEMEFDLRNILPSERPSQTISYLPPESSNDQFTSPGPGWGNDGIRPQPQPHLMRGPTHPSNRLPML